MKEGVPQGTVFTFTMESTDSKIYPGIAREPDTLGTADPNDPAKLIVTTSHPAPYTRRVAVYVPKQYVPGTARLSSLERMDRTAPVHRARQPDRQQKVPVMIAISIGNGGGDAQGSERGLEYDTMSGMYAEFVEKEVLPLVEKKYNVKLTKDPEGARDDGRQFRRFSGADHGVVSPGAVSPRAHLLRHLRESAVAVQSGDSARRVGVP